MQKQQFKGITHLIRLYLSSIMTNDQKTPSFLINRETAVVFHIAIFNRGREKETAKIPYIPSCIQYLHLWNMFRGLGFYAPHIKNAQLYADELELP